MNIRFPHSGPDFVSDPADIGYPRSKLYLYPRSKLHRTRTVVFRYLSYIDNLLYLFTMGSLGPKTLILVPEDWF